MKVEIDAGGRRVTVECGDTNTSVKEVIAEVGAAWKDTEGAHQPSEGPAFGLNLQQRANAVSPMNMGGSYRTGYVREPKAEAVDG